MDKSAQSPGDDIDKLLEAVTRLEKSVAGRLERDQLTVTRLQESLNLVESEKAALAVAHNKAIDRLDQIINRLHKLFNS
ncbi:MAG: hypothetical protein ORN98_09320 [Alphaproteobacteria bacterium]|nr:hypothetical protein [Alphaproteobacteria bacterium]